ncbi:hypothetical protein PVAP13_5NG229924 [Panicum virgatum]|uniref:Uncharacterized protein n=1 Tax=Panicum virgatum TaxID=38727 RepID=A0A8T0RQG0_PANVG|nr:hypothetical protein PVAP13_5NG229924 [Panicum virgatum]
MNKFNLNDSWIMQIVEFNGQFITVDRHHGLYTVSLAPQLGLKGIAIEWWDDMLEWPLSQPWLLAWSRMLLTIDSYMLLFRYTSPNDYKVYHLDMSTEPATCVSFHHLCFLELIALSCWSGYVSFHHMCFFMCCVSFHHLCFLGSLLRGDPR